MSKRLTARTRCIYVSDSEAVREFSAWYGQTCPRLSRVLRVTIGDPGVAEEAAAEAFARAFAQWGRVRSMESRDGWVYRVALNIVRSWARREALERRTLRRLQAPEHVPEPPAPEDALWIAVAALSPRARQAVALRYIADMAENDIADVMGVTRGSVGATLHKARRQLAAALGPRSITEQAG